MPVLNGIWVAPDRVFGTSGWGIRAVPGRKEPMWLESEVDKLTNTALHQLRITRGIAMDIEQVAVETTGAANNALKELKVTIDKFKSTIANDLTAIKSASTRVQSETLQMRQEYMAAQQLLTTPDFERAIANAERLATALTAIQALNETKVSLAVFNGRDGAVSP